MHSNIQPTGTMNVASAPTKAGLWISQRETVRTLRVQRHLAVAFLAGWGCVFVAPIADTLLGLPLISIFVFVVLDSLARAMDAHLGFMWGWLYGEPERTTRLDRIVHHIVQRLAAAQAHRRVAAQVDDPPPRVRPL